MAGMGWTTVEGRQEEWATMSLPVRREERTKTDRV